MENLRSLAFLVHQLLEGCEGNLVTWQKHTVNQCDTANWLIRGRTTQMTFTQIRKAIDRADGEWHWKADLIYLLFVF